MSINPGVDAGAAPTQAPSVPSGGTAQQALAALEELVGSVATVNAMINSLSAWRAELIEAVRTWSQASSDVLVSDPWTPGAQHTAHLAVVAELACALSLPEQTASRLVDESQILTATCPATLAALREGVISYRHAQVVLEHTDGLDPDDCAELESRLLSIVPGLTATKFANRARRERERAHPIPLAERHAKVRPNRCVEVDPARDGMAWLHAYLPAAETMAIFHRVSDVAAAVQHPSDPRTLPELRADAFSALMLDDEAHDAFRRACSTSGPHSPDAPLCEDAAGDGDRTAEGGADDSTADSADPADSSTQDTAAAASWGRAMSGPLDRGRLLRGVRASVAVTVPVLTLLGLSESPGQLEGYGPIDAETARILAGHAPSFRRILTHPETGAVLSVGRDSYTVPADLKAAVRLRDETCRFPGCSRRAKRCDIDHVTDWALGGATEQGNLMLLCRRHHRLKHLSRWQPRILTSSSPLPPDSAAPRPGPLDGAEKSGRSHPTPVDGAVEWTAPSGRLYCTDPASTDVAPRLGFAFLLSLGLSADFLLRIGIAPTADDVDTPWASDPHGPFAQPGGPLTQPGDSLAHPSAPGQLRGSAQGPRAHPTGFADEPPF